MTDISLPPQFEGTGDRIAYLLAEYRLAVYVALGAGALAVFTGRLGIPAVPSFVGLVLQITAIGIVPVTVGAYVVVNRYVPDPRRDVLVLDPNQDGYTIGTAQVPSELWSSREHVADKPVMHPAGKFDAVVTQLDYDDEINRLQVEGANPEIADPANVIATNGKLDETFGELDAAAADLERIKATATTRERNVEKRIINAVIGAVESGSSIEPGLAEGEIFGELFDDVENGSKPVDETRDDERDLERIAPKLYGTEETNGNGDSKSLQDILQ